MNLKKLPKLEMNSLKEKRNNTYFVTFKKNIRI